MIAIRYNTMKGKQVNENINKGKKQTDQAGRSPLLGWGCYRLVCKKWYFELFKEF
jgi:hypothetical protein